MGGSGINDALQTSLGTVAHIGFGRGAADERDMPVAECNQVLDSRTCGGVIINAHACVEPIGGGDVDADNRHVHMLQSLHLSRFDVEGADNHRIRIASHGQIRKEVMALGGVAHGGGHSVVAGGAQRRVKAGEDVCIEPGGDGLAGQQRNAERLAGLQCGGRARDGVVELFGRGHHSVSSLWKH